MARSAVVGCGSAFQHHPTWSMVLSREGKRRFSRQNIGLRDLVARGHFIPGAHEPEGGCLVGRRRFVSQVVGHGEGSEFAGSGWVPSGHARVP